MNDELASRQRAISLRLAGRPVKSICSALGRSEAWFHKWWGRYVQAGPEALYDRTRAHHHVAQRIPPELERAIRSIRRRLQAHTTPATRYCLIGATALRAELKALGIREQVQLDNARELSGWGPAARYRSRVIRFCLRFGVGPVFIPAGEPQFNGGVENFNGWFQPRLFDRRYTRPGDLRRELAR